MDTALFISCNSTPTSSHISPTPSSSPGGELAQVATSPNRTLLDAGDGRR
jgi:hypothetical protein